MILTSIDKCREIEDVHPKMKLFIDFILSHDLKQLPQGKNVIDGDEVFANHDFSQAKELEVQTLEMHRKYIDVHVLLEGEETIGIKPTTTVTNITVPYNEEKDFCFANEPADEYYTLKPGDMLVAFPNDAHAPLIGEGVIEKLVGKILL